MAQLTPTRLTKKPDVFQIKGLRKRLGFKHTNWDRTATNQTNLEAATEENLTMKQRLHGIKTEKLRNLVKLIRKGERNCYVVLSEQTMRILLHE